MTPNELPERLEDKDLSGVLRDEDGFIRAECWPQTEMDTDSRDPRLAAEIARRWNAHCELVEFINRVYQDALVCDGVNAKLNMSFLKQRCQEILLKHKPHEHTD